MKLEKHLICLLPALKVASKKLGLPIHPSNAMLGALAAIRQLKGSCTIPQLLSYLQSKQCTLDRNNLWNDLVRLEKLGLIHREYVGSRCLWSVSPLGRELMSRVRNYLVNVRL